MPKGEPNAQTKATREWQTKAGYISKSFKIKKDLADAFAKKCNAAGVSQAGQISKMMKAFIESEESSV